MRENFSCYKNEPLKLGQIKAIAESVKATRGEQTCLLDNRLLKNTLFNELNELDELDELNKLDENLSPAKSPSPYILEGGSSEQPLIHRLNYGQNYIGRDDSNDLVLADSHISRLHAILLIHLDNRAAFFDLRSLNGITVNGKKVTEALLVAGDEINLANCYWFTFKLNNSNQIANQEELYNF